MSESDSSSVQMSGPQLAPTLGEYFTGKRRFVHRRLGEHPRIFAPVGDLCLVGGQVYVRREANLYPNEEAGLVWLAEFRVDEVDEQKRLVCVVRAKVEVHVAQEVDKREWLLTVCQCEGNGEILRVDLREWRRAAIERAVSDEERGAGKGNKPAQLKKAG